MSEGKYCVIVIECEKLNMHTNIECVCFRRFVSTQKQCMTSLGYLPNMILSRKSKRTCLEHILRLLCFFFSYMYVSRGCAYVCVFYCWENWSWKISDVCDSFNMLICIYVESKYMKKFAYIGSENVMVWRSLSIVLEMRCMCVCLCILFFFDLFFFFVVR